MIAVKARVTYSDGREIASAIGASRESLEFVVKSLLKRLDDADFMEQYKKQILDGNHLHFTITVSPMSF